MFGRAAGGLVDLVKEEAEAFEFLVKVEDGAFEALLAERQEVEFAWAIEVGLGLAESCLAGGVVIAELAGVGFDAESEDVWFPPI